MTYRIAFRCGEFRPQRELRADGDPWQDRSIHLDELGLIGVGDLLGVLQVLRCDVALASTQANELVQEPDPEGDQECADSAEKHETKYRPSEPH